MKINFYYESGEIYEVGTGHSYRAKELSKEFRKRGHTTTMLGQSRSDVLVIDHIHSQQKMIKSAKQQGTYVVLIDGAEQDVDAADISFSTCFNARAQYSGIKYIVFPTNSYNTWKKYSPQTSKKSVFVSMGGYDINNRAEFVLGILDDMGISAVVTKSINHSDLKSKFDKVEVFEGENYYDAMSECVIGITNGGLTMFQALFYGLPIIPLPQYEHQSRNIDCVQHCCLPAKVDEVDIRKKIEHLMSSEYTRTNLSMMATNFVDGRGASRVCSLVERDINEIKK